MENKKDLDIKLAHGVEQYPILWDCTSAMYKRNDLKPEAWTEVTKYVGAPATVEWAQKRFKNMRDTFNENYRKVRESKRSGAGSEEIFQPSWHLYKHLTFLIKTCAQAKSTSNLNIEPVPQQETTPIQQVLGSAHYDESLKQWFYIPSEEAVESNSDPSLLVNDIENDANISSVGDDLNESVCSMVSVGPSPAPSTAVSVDRSFHSLMSSTQRPSSCPPEQTGKKRVVDEDDHFFNKKGSTKKSSNLLLVQAVHAMEKIANESALTPPPSGPTSNGSILDRLPILTFVGKRMETMDEETRKRFENALMQLLMQY